MKYLNGRSKSYLSVITLNVNGSNIKICLWPNIWAVLKNVPFVLECKVFLAVVRWADLWMSIRSS